MDNTLRRSTRTKVPLIHPILGEKVIYEASPSGQSEDCVCLCVCVSVSLCVSVYLCLYVSVSVGGACLHVLCLSAYLSVSVYMCMFIYVQGGVDRGGLKGSDKPPFKPGFILKLANYLSSLNNKHFQVLLTP